MEKPKIILILSGGLDSSVLLHHLVTEGHVVKTLAFNYGQRHSRELSFAAYQAQKAGVPHIQLPMMCLLPVLGGSSQTDKNIPVPHGHYEEESMKATVVPNRNMIMLSIATAFAISEKFDAVAFAAHAGDHAIYPDCRKKFTQALGRALALCHYTPIQLLQPFADMSKTDIVLRGQGLGVDFFRTYSCYEGEEFHCGKCGTCTERIMSFAEAKVPDPTIYRDRTLVLKYWPNAPARASTQSPQSAAVAESASGGATGSAAPTPQSSPE